MNIYCAIVFPCQNLCKSSILFFSFTFHVTLNRNLRHSNICQISPNTRGVTDPAWRHFWDRTCFFGLDNCKLELVETRSVRFGRERNALDGEKSESQIRS